MYRATPDQRWAYKFGVEPVLVGSDELKDYGCYGTPVVAPTSADVWHVVDGNPDQIPGITKTNDPFGNTVILKLGASFLVLAHLRNNSVIVKAGDKVKEGQKLAECGNSGASEEPHIHIHHQRQDPVTSAIGLAEGLPLYFTKHGAARMPRGGISDGRALGEHVQHIVE